MFLSACSSLVLDEVEKQSTCELEVDAVAVDILNRLEIESKITQDNIRAAAPLHQYCGPLWHSGRNKTGGRKSGERSSAESFVLKVQHIWLTEHSCSEHLPLIASTHQIH